MICCWIGIGWSSKSELTSAGTEYFQQQACSVYLHVGKQELLVEISNRYMTLSFHYAITLHLYLILSQHVN